MIKKKAASRTRLRTLITTVVTLSEKRDKIPNKGVTKWDPSPFTPTPQRPKIAHFQK